MTAQLAAECNAVDDEANRLAPSARAIYFGRCTKELKDPDSYFALMWVFGLFGAHYFYLGKYAQGVTTVLSTLIGLTLAFYSLQSSDPEKAAFGFFLFFGGVLILFVFHLISGWTGVSRYNLELKRSILAECQDKSPFRSSP